MLPVKVWILAARPKTLGACVAPVVIGAAIALQEQIFDTFLFAVTLLTALLIQVGTNFCNDYFDFIKGADTKERLGPTRATQAGLVTPQVMKKAFIGTFLLASILGLYLVYKGGVPILLIGVLSIASGILYTASPYALGYLGLSDIFVLIFFGPVSALGTYYLQTHKFSLNALLAGFSPGFLSLAILTVNNLRDIKQDVKVHKKTLAVRFGANFSKAEYVLAIVLAALIPCFMVFVLHAPWPIILSSVVLLLALPLMKKVLYVNRPQELNDVLGKTGKLTLLFGFLFAFGYLF